MTLRVGMISPISHEYDPAGYGPWERVTHDLTEYLVADGVDVTLFAPATSTTAARLIATVPAPLSQLEDPDARLHETLHVAVAMEEASKGFFDVVHSHLHVHALPFAPLIGVPLVTTLHGAAWNRAHHPLLTRYRDAPYVSISDREREFLPELNYVATVANGVDLAHFPFGSGRGDYLAFVGRMAPEKGPDIAVQVARQAGIELRLAGPVEDRHREFFDTFMRDAPGVEYVGPLPRGEVATFMGQARALIMPLRWEEPFGLVVIESLATGTPVVAWRRGAMPEIIEDGTTGLLVDDVASAVRAVSAVNTLDRRDCRRSVEHRFSATRMAREYRRVYETLTSSRREPRPRG